MRVYGMLYDFKIIMTETLTFIDTNTDPSTRFGCTWDHSSKNNRKTRHVPSHRILRISVAIICIT
jgi:hypothetical protein